MVFVGTVHDHCSSNLNGGKVLGFNFFQIQYFFAQLHIFVPSAASTIVGQRRDKTAAVEFQGDWTEPRSKSTMREAKGVTRFSNFHRFKHTTVPQLIQTHLIFKKNGFFQMIGFYTSNVPRFTFVQQLHQFVQLFSKLTPQTGAFLSSKATGFLVALVLKQISSHGIGGIQHEFCHVRKQSVFVFHQETLCVVVDFPRVVNDRKGRGIL
jgi:hypothetical protein